MEPATKLIVLTGPTAVGKSALAMALAERFGAEVVSADSRQVYRGMAIGTAAPTAEDQARVPHHLLGHAEPREPYDVAIYQRQAEVALSEIAERGRAAILVGGSYHYLRAVVERLRLPSAPPKAELRRALEQEAELNGPAAMHARLARVDPMAAAKILAGNVRRTIRALEVIEQTGQLFSAQSQSRGPARPCLRLALTCDRGELYRRIDERVEAMLRAGWLDEVRALSADGARPQMPARSASGYRELAAYLRGECALAEAMERTKFSTHAFARRQYAWFRRDEALRWLARGPDLFREAEALVSSYVTQSAGEE